jgi:hypothetical protein
MALKNKLKRGLIIIIPGKKGMYVVESVKSGPFDEVKALKLDDKTLEPAMDSKPTTICMNVSKSYQGELPGFRFDEIEVRGSMELDSYQKSKKKSAKSAPKKDTKKGSKKSTEKKDEATDSADKDAPAAEPIE